MPGVACEASLMRLPRSRRDGFTLIELLVVIAVIALLVGILLPALAGARESAKRAVCLSNIRQVSTNLTLYTSDYKGWYPVFPGFAPSQMWTNQWRYGGVAGLFSITQYGEDGVQGGNDDGYAVGQYVGGRTLPLMDGYIDSFEALTCPSDRLDLAWPVTTAPNSRRYLSGTPKTPKKPGSEFEVTPWNVSYLYIAGFRLDEPILVAAAPLFGDEANASDIGTDSWYGNSQDAQAAGTQINVFAKDDNHGKDGGNYVYTDTHAAFVKGDVAASFFTGGSSNPQNVNVIDPTRSSRLQTID
jgi:prepilin-type N-terminal cleavage/methylation domain-containing protein